VLPYYRTVTVISQAGNCRQRRGIQGV